MQLEKNQSYHISYTDTHSIYDYIGPARYTGNYVLSGNITLYEFDNLIPQFGCNSKGWFTLDNVSVLCYSI